MCHTSSSFPQKKKKKGGKNQQFSQFLIFSHSNRKSIFLVLLLDKKISIFLMSSLIHHLILYIHIKIQSSSILQMSRSNFYFFFSFFHLSSRSITIPWKKIQFLSPFFQLSLPKIKGTTHTHTYILIKRAKKRKRNIDQISFHDTPNSSIQKEKEREQWLPLSRDFGPWQHLAVKNIFFPVFSFRLLDGLGDPCFAK